MITEKDVKRFEAKILKAICWTWTASKLKDGYGAFAMGRKTFQAHRFSYELYVGKIAQGMNVLHTCDNPACVNPEHLFLGTQRDNIHDMMAKGRHGLPYSKRK